MQVNLPITDPQVIASLPDTSVYALFFDENITADKAKDYFSQKPIRRKLQYLFTYSLPKEIQDKLIAKLIEAFENGEIQDEDNSDNSNNQEPIQVSPTMVQVGNTIYDFRVLSVGNSFFSKDNFNNIFFTEDMINYVFGLNDVDFEKALMSVPEFWNILLSKDNLFDTLVKNFPEKVERAKQEVETAFVKIITYQAGLNFENYDSTLDLASDETALSIIKGSNVKDEMYKTLFGFKTLVIHQLNISSISIDDLFAKISTPLNNDLVEIFENVSALEYLYQAITQKQGSSGNLDKASKSFSQIVDNDVLLGKALSNYLGIEELTFTQLLNTPEYKEMVAGLLLDDRASVLFEVTKLLQQDSLYKKLISIIDEFFHFKNKPYCKPTSAEDMVYVYAKSGRDIYALDVTFTDDSSTQSVEAKKITGSKYPVMPLIGSLSNKVAYITTGLTVYTEDSYLQSSIAFLNGKHLVFADVNKDHIVAIDKDDNVISSKFAQNDKVSSLKEAVITPNIAIIRDKTKVVALGDFLNGTALEIRDVINSQLENIETLFGLKDRVFAVMNDGSIKEATKDGLIDSAVIDNLKNGDLSAKANRVKKAINSMDTLFVLDKTGMLWYEDRDSSIKTIENIANIELAGYGLYVEPKDGNPYLLVPYNNSIRKYDYTNNLS